VLQGVGFTVPLTTSAFIAEKACTIQDMPCSETCKKIRPVGQSLLVFKNCFAARSHRHYTNCIAVLHTVNNHWYGK
jgi:hypothetical protein